MKNSQRQLHKLFLTLTMLGFLNSLSADVIRVNVFQDQIVQFNPKHIPDGFNDNKNIIQLANGRVAIKKITIPTFVRNTKAEIMITLTSNGDRWDKSGSCFIIPRNSATNMINIAKGEKKYPQIDSTKLERLVGITPATDYKPTVELMRFMTPFGVGHFSNPTDALSQKRKPVYIEGWAKNVMWKQNVSDLLPLLQGEVYVGVFIDTWTEEGYKISVDLNFDESNIKQDKMPKRHVESLINTVYYLGQSIPDIFSRKNINIPFEISPKAKNIRLKYITTGHGGHSGGDEFVQKENILSVDGVEAYRFTPWRNDCASFRRFNPSTGVWLIKRTVAYIGEGGRLEKEIEEPLGSSDLSRSNWCPGSDVTPETIMLNNIKVGSHTLTISIPKAQAAKGNELNHWLVSAYLVWEE